MPSQLTWDNTEDLGILLSETHPELNPLEVRLTDLQRYVTELAEFKGNPQAPSAANLEAIRIAWNEEFLDRTQG